MTITDAGAEALGTPEALPAGRALLEYWMAHPRLTHGDREILRVLSENSEGLPKEEIAAQTLSPRGTPYEPTGGGFNNSLGRLRTLGIIEGYGPIQLSEELKKAALEA